MSMSTSTSHMVTQVNSFNKSVNDSDTENLKMGPFPLYYFEFDCEDK